jgi:hypothetical protein
VRSAASSRIPEKLQGSTGADFEDSSPIFRSARATGTNAVTELVGEDSNGDPDSEDFGFPY